MCKKKNKVRQARVLYLYSIQEGKCYYCGCHCSLLTHDQHEGKKPPDNMATLEHLYDHWDLRRPFMDQLPDRVKFAMACYKCNQQRGIDRFKKLELQHRIRVFDIKQFLYAQSEK